jgi:hypothetical protein
MTVDPAASMTAVTAVASLAGSPMGWEELLSSRSRRSAYAGGAGAASALRALASVRNPPGSMPRRARCCGLRHGPAPAPREGARPARAWPRWRGGGHDVESATRVESGQRVLDRLGHGQDGGVADPLERGDALDLDLAFEVQGNVGQQVAEERIGVRAARRHLGHRRGGHRRPGFEPIRYYVPPAHPALGGQMEKNVLVRAEVAPYGGPAERARWKEEIFGPVPAVIPCANDEEFDATVSARLSGIACAVASDRHARFRQLVPG